MFRKSYWKKRFAPVLAGALVISSLLVPPGHAFAADPVTSEEQTVSPETRTMCPRMASLVRRLL